MSPTRALRRVRDRGAVGSARDHGADRLRLRSRAVDVVLAFAATIVALRLAAELVRRRHLRPQPGLLAWAAALGAFAVAAAAMTWGTAAGWDDRAFRVYYLFGGLLAAALLGTGSLLRVGRGWAGSVALVYVGLAVGLAMAEPLTSPVSGTSIPDAQAHLDLLPARLLAIVGNTVGTLAAVGVALATFGRRPLGNTLLIAGIGVAALGSTLTGLGVSESSAALLVSVCLLYAGVVVRR